VDRRDLRGLRVASSHVVVIAAEFSGMRLLPTADVCWLGSASIRSPAWLLIDGKFRVARGGTVAVPPVITFPPSTIARASLLPPVP
jgi:hypothetical protein